LQKIVRSLRRGPLERGWYPLLRALATVCPQLKKYRVALCDGDRLFVDLSQRMCMGYFFYGGLPHEENVHTAFERMVRWGDTAIDVGANIGYYTRLFSRLVGDDGRVWAFEPLPAAQRLLRMNVENLTNVTVVEEALSASNGTAMLSIQAAGDTSTLLPRRGIASLEVRTRTLDSMNSCFERVDWLKVDVEGEEFAVLQGAREVLRNHQPLVCFEFIPDVAAVDSVTLPKLINLFESINEGTYEVLGLAVRPDGGLEVTNPSCGGSNLFAIPSRFKGRLEEAIHQ
jgi:FkbM family methyltransferase